ncbi:MAG: DnaJ domain-containing protein [Bacteroidota bacterium]
MNKDYYKILELNSSATQEEIRKAFHRLAMRYHPDITGGNSEYAELFKEINEAYRILSDALRKARYDLGLRIDYIIPSQPFIPYLTAEVNTKSVLLNEEFEITYRYAGEGRVFQKPELSSITYLCSPVVNHRTIHIHGGIKETSLTYTICALETGKLILPPATIYINNKYLSSESLSVEVKENACYFTKGQLADHHPYPVYLNKEREVTSTFRRIFIYRQIVLLPRSNYARYYHELGTSMKNIFAVMGFIMALLYDYNWLLGIVAGSLAGGLLCHSMYLLTGVKSKFYHDLKYKTVVKYFEENYRPGRDPSYGIFAGRCFYQFIQLFR